MSEPRVLQAEVTEPPRPAPRPTSGQTATWYAIVVVATAAAAVVALLVNPRFYYYDDTQTGAAGIWYQFGRSILSGELDYLNLTTWGSGNTFVEGQWGVLNPLMWLISIGAALSSNLLLYITGVKILLLIVAATGTTALARALGATLPVAAVVGVAAPLNGFTVYMDASSWATGLFAFAWFPWLWWSLHRLSTGRGGLLAPAALSYVIVTNGYFHGTLLAGCLLASYALAALLRRAWPNLTAFIVLGLFMVAAATPVYLPSILTASVTRRSAEGITSSGFLGPDVSDLLTATALAPGVEIPSWAGPVLAVPIFYIAWILPALMIGALARLRRAPEALQIGLFLTAVLLFMLGPTDVGPLRFPVRVFPYFAVAVLAAVAVGRTHLGVGRTGTRPSHWLPIVLGLPLIGAWLTFADIPQGWKRQLAGLVLVVGALLLVLFLESRLGRIALTSAIVLAITVAFTGVQRSWVPETFIPDFGLPGTISELKRPLSDLDGQTFVIGNRDNAPVPELWDESLMANSWQINDAEVQNAYVVIGYRAYNDLLQMDYLGLTTPGTLDTLLEVDATTGLTLADELGIQNLQLWRHTLPDRDLESPPAGWQLERSQTYTVVWLRDQRAAPLGGPIHVTPGASVDVLSNTDDTIQMRVTNPNSAPATIILSRLDWPGYRVEGAAQLADPHRGFLLTLTVPPGTTDAEVTVSFTPPGFVPGVLLLAGGTLLILLAELLRRRRRSTVGAELRLPDPAH